MATKKEIVRKYNVVSAIVKDGKIQIEKRLKVGSALYGFYLVPGGNMEEGETKEETLFREIKEEYDIVPKKYYFLGTVVSKDDNLVIYSRHVYLITSWAGLPSNPESKNDQIELTFAEARKLCAHPVTQKILDLVEAKLSR